MENVPHVTLLLVHSAILLYQTVLVIVSAVSAVGVD
jgi:hypothetical protein